MRPICVCALLSLCRPALAQVMVPLPPQISQALSGEDVLTLRDGSILRGRVTEMRPGDHVELVLLDGRAQTIPWADIAKSVGPSFPEARQNPADRYLKPSPGRVPVQLEAPRSLTVGVLRRRPLIGQDAMTFDDDGDVSQLTVDFQSSTGVVVCAGTPCRICARPGPLRLQASGEGVLAYTGDLTVPMSGAHVKLRAPSARQRRIGSSLLWGSLSVAIIGGVAMGLGAAFGNAADNSDPRLMMTPPPDHSGIYYGIGGALLGAGGLMIVSGIVLLAVNQRGIDSVTPLADGVRF